MTLSGDFSVHKERREREGSIFDSQPEKEDFRGSTRPNSLLPSTHFNLPKRMDKVPDKNRNSNGRQDTEELTKDLKSFSEKTSKY